MTNRKRIFYGIIAINVAAAISIAYTIGKRNGQMEGYRQGATDGYKDAFSLLQTTADSDLVSGQFSPTP